MDKLMPLPVKVVQSRHSSLGLARLPLLVVIGLCVAVWVQWPKSECKKHPCFTKTELLSPPYNDNNEVPTTGALTRVLANNSAEKAKPEVAAAAETEAEDDSILQAVYKALASEVAKAELAAKKAKETELNKRKEPPSARSIQVAALQRSYPPTQIATLPTQSSDFASNYPSHDDSESVSSVVESEASTTLSESGDGQFSPQETVQLPACDSADAIVVSRLNQLNSALFKSARIVCITPGDYRAAAPLVIEQSGNTAAPKVLRSTIDDDNTSPFNDSSMVLLPPLKLSGAKHWIVDGMAWQDGDTAITVDNGSHIVLNRNRSNKTSNAITVTGIFDNIEIRDNWLLADDTADSSCIKIRASDSSSVLHIVGNQLESCATAIDLENTAGELRFLLANNDIHNDNTSGCARYGVHVKVSNDALLFNRITGNRISGWQSAPNCTEASTALLLESPSSHLQVDKNIFSDNSTAIHLGSHARKIAISENILANALTQENTHTLLEVDQNAQAVNISANHFVGGKPWLETFDESIAVQCNVVLDSGRATGVTVTEGVIDKNAYFNSSPGVVSSSNSNDLFYTHTRWAHMTPVCFDSKPLSGSDAQCISNALSTTRSPSLCGNNAWYNEDA